MIGQKYEILVYFAWNFSKIGVVDLAFFIARRTARSAPGNRPGVMERIAVGAVAVSVAVMIVTLAVVMGFKREIAYRLSGLSAHAVVTDRRSVGALDAHPVLRTERLEELIASVPGYVAAAPYALCGGIVRTADAVEETVLKGVGPEYDLAFFGESLVAGELPRIGDTVRTKDVLLSRTMAERLALGVGDRVEMLFVGSDVAPRRDRFRISGIYASGMDEMDAAVALTDIRNVQRLSEWGPDEVTGYELRAADLDASGAFAAELGERLFYDDGDQTQNLSVVSLQELYPHVFDWLKAHDVNAAVIVAIMLAVAFFNMASALLILVFERVRMIGLLKALGMTDGGLRRLFLYRAAFVALRGAAWGNAVGLGLCFVQGAFHLVRLDAEGYLLSVVPVDVGWGWWLALNAGALAAVVALSVLPASAIASVKPEETIRYE